MLHEYGHEHSCFKKENLLPLEVGNSPILRGIISLEREKKLITIMDTMRTRQFYLEGFDCMVVTNQNPFMYL
jgi:hypothetical protein